MVQLAGYIPSVKAIFNKLVNPEMEIPRFTSTIHGIYDKDVAQAQNFKVVWNEFQEFISLHLKDKPNTIPVLAGHNIWGYDMDVYKAESERTGVTKLFWKSFDTLFFAKNRFKGIKGAFQKGFFKQEYLAPLLGINISGAHDAKNDVIASAKLFKALSYGFSESDCSKAILSDHPIKELGEQNKNFDGGLHFANYRLACDLSLDLAKFYFEGIDNPSFFEPLNLCATLNINARADDPKDFTLWRIFLHLTEGVKRKTINQALQEENPLDALMKLCKKDGSFQAENCKNHMMMACKIVISLAKTLFKDKKDAFFAPENLFALVGLNTTDREPSISDLKRLFLKFTAGVPQEPLNEALENANVEDIVALILEKGSFNPSRYLENESRSNLNMEVEGEKNSLKRNADEEEEFTKNKKLKI